MTTGNRSLDFFVSWSCWLTLPETTGWYHCKRNRKVWNNYPRRMAVKEERERGKKKELQGCQKIFPFIL